MSKYIPSHSTLSLITFLKKSKKPALTRQGRVDLPFPISQKTISFHYLARNAIWQAIDVLGLKKEDEVLFPIYNSGVENQPFQKKKIKLVFFDINNDLTVPVDKLDPIVTSRTKALYIIHYFGFSQNLEEVLNFCQKNNLFLIEDCALALLSCDKNKPLGSFGDLSIFCFKKSLPIPAGGALVVNNKNLSLKNINFVSPSFYSVLTSLFGLLIKNLIQSKYFLKSVIGRILKLILNFPLRLFNFFSLKRVNPEVHQFEENKANWAMPKITNFLIKKLDYKEIKKRRRENFKFLLDKIKSDFFLSQNLKLPFDDLPDGVVPLFFPIIFPERQKLVNFLKNQGIEAEEWWKFEKDSFDEFKKSFPITTYLKENLLELPCHQDIEKEDLEYIVKILKKLFIR